MKFLRSLLRSLPTFLTALIFAVAIWTFAVTQNDPTQTRSYPRVVPVEVIGLSQNLMIVNDIAEQINLTLRAPSSILTQLENDISLITVTLDLSGLEPGVHTLEPQVNIALSPVEVVRINPASQFVKLETIVTASFPIKARTLGNPAIGFEIQTPELSEDTVTVSGPQSQVDMVALVYAEVSIVDIAETIQRTVDLVACDSDGLPIDGVILNPGAVEVLIPVTQRGGYRTVVVRIITSGQIAPGYRLTNIFAQPPTVTIFSSDPTLVEGIPGFIETTPINLNGTDENLEIRVALNLPEGINVVGSQNVTVQISIEPIQSSIAFSNILIQTEGLAEGMVATFSPESVDVFLSGPMNALESLDPATLIVVIDLTGRGAGTYQLAPQVFLEDDAIRVDALLPSTIEVTLTNGN